MATFLVYTEIIFLISMVNPNIVGLHFDLFSLVLLPDTYLTYFYPAQV